MEQTDIAIIGAGVIGLAIAYELSNLDQAIVVIEKNASFGEETSSRNSEVIHAGLYYPHGSLKAETCIEGRRLLYELCTKYNLAHKKLGKLVVAPSEGEIAAIESIYRNALRCGVEDLRLIDKNEAKKLEPDIDVKIALYSPQSGIIDSHALMRFLYQAAKEKGVLFAFLNEAVGIKRADDKYRLSLKEPNGALYIRGQKTAPFRVRMNNGRSVFRSKKPRASARGASFNFESRVVINSAGLNSDKIAEFMGLDIEKLGYKISYCKGQYFRIRNPQKFSIRHLVYPPATKTDLGIHITPDLAQGLRLGPDAKYVDKVDYSVEEKDKIIFFNSIRRFLPLLEMEDLTADTAGMRPKLQGENDDFCDFVIKDEAENGFPGLINLIGIESPGLTACLSIAERVKRMAGHYLAG